MVVIINKSPIDDIVRTKDARSESVDSFSSTVDVRREVATKDPPANATLDDRVEEPVEDPPSPPRFDLLLTSDHPSLLDEGHRRALSRILLLDSPSRPAVRSLLDAHDGRLVDVGHALLEGLRSAAPPKLAARVGDYNENLFYEMRDLDQDLGSIIRAADGADDERRNDAVRRDVEAFERSVRRSLNCDGVKYRGSFMRTERTMYQPAHVDYDYPILEAYRNRLFLAFFPLTEEGAFLQLWRDRASEEERGGRRREEGTVVHVPQGKMLIVPSDTIHGGGFKRGCGGNLRFHLYIDAEDDGASEAETEEGKIELLDHPMNRYTERHDRRRELCERFVDADGLDGLLGTFFDA